MKTSVSQKIRTGIFTVAGIVLLIAGIFFIGAKKNMFDKTFMIYGIFKNVGGLEQGNNIRFAGINAGTVEKINMLSDTTIRIDMLIKENVRPFLKIDAMAIIGSDGLMGDKMITITPGSAAEIRLMSSGSQITTTSPVDYDKVIYKLTQVADNASVITGELAAMAVQIKNGKGALGRLLYTDNLSESIEGTVQNAERLTGSLAGMSASFGGTVDNAEKITGSLASIASHVQSGRGTLGRLIYTDSLSGKLERTVTSANSAVLTIQEGAYGFSENMKALQGNYFLKGYFKKKAEAEAEQKSSGVQKTVVVPETITSDMEEKELAGIIAEAQKALDEKRLKDKK